jgi:hypothetical protein
MAVTNAGGSGSTKQIVVDTNPVHKAGQDICKSASDLDSYVNGRPGRWTDFQSLVAPLPMCLSNDFNNFYNNHKPKLDDLIKNRNKIGQTLQQSATLWEFQEAVTAKNFGGPNIYGENSYYTPYDQPGRLNMTPPQLPGEPDRTPNDNPDTVPNGAPIS